MLEIFEKEVKVSNSYVCSCSCGCYCPVPPIEGVAINQGTHNTYENSAKDGVQ